jgi:hypothetical protein
MRIMFGNNVLKITLSRYVWTEGVSSKCEDGYHVLFLDFDNVSLSSVQSVCRTLQNSFGCGTFHIFESSENSYHAICLDKLKFSETVQLQLLSGCDRSYVSKSIKRGYAVVRFASKGSKGAPAYLFSMVASSDRLKSLAHGRWIALNYSVNINDTDGGELWDKFSKINIDKYATFEKHKTVKGVGNVKDF